MRCVFLKRSQFSLELFVVLTFFVLVLLWFNNFYGSLRNQDLLFLQQRNLLNQVSLLQSESFASNQTVFFVMPCFTWEGKSVVYWIYGGKVDSQGNVIEGANETTVFSVVYSSNQSLAAVFPVNATPNPLAFECAGDNAGQIVFSREKVKPPGELVAIDGVLMRKG